METASFPLGIKCVMNLFSNQLLAKDQQIGCKGGSFTKTIMMWL